MRRKIGYILFSGALLLGAAALLGPTLLHLNTDISYGTGKDLVFKISEKDSTLNGVTADNYVDDDGSAVDLVGEEFEARLKEWGTEADVIKEGPDTVRVRIRSQKEEVEYRYLQNYLPFSGGWISVGASLDTDEEYEVKDSWSEMFDGQEARIEYVKVATGEVPAVVIPVNEPGLDGDFENLVSFCNTHNHEADEEHDVAASTCYLVLWSHKQEGDTYAKASGGEEADNNVASRLIFAEDASYAWYDAPKDDDDHTQFQLIPSSSALSEQGFDPSKASEAYMAATYYKLLLNASDYGELGAGYDITFAFSTDVQPTAEALTLAGAWSRHPALSTTAIASLISLAFVAILLIVYYRMGSLAILSSMGFTLMGDLLLYSVFGAQFGVGALLGVLISLLVSAFGGMYYFSKFKEQLYQGRSTKKAHSEAAKRALWPTLDLSVVSIIVGVCVYGFVPSFAGKAGLMLVIGGFFAGLYNLLVLRLQGYMLANDNTVFANPARVYNVDASKIPNLAAEEKPTYFGSFSKVDFKKGFRPAAILSGILGLACIVGLIVFGAKGNIYNYSTQYDNSTISYVEYRAAQNSLLIVNNETELQSEVIDKITLNGEKLGVESIKLEDSTIYLTTDEKTIDVHYYTINWANYYADDATYDFVVTVSGTESHFLNLRDALTFAVDSVLPSEDTHITVSNTEGTAGTPSVGAVWLGVGVGLAISLVYLSARYKLSRGITLSFLAGGAGLLASGFFALTRITVPAVTAMGPLAAIIFTIGAGLFILNKEKELYRDSREKDKDNLAFRSQCISTAVSQEIEDILMLSFVALGTPLIFLGVSIRSWSYMHLGSIVGIVFGAALIVLLLAPSAIALAKGLKRLHLSLKPLKKENSNDNDNKAKRRSSEPEEATFIGIND